MPISGGYSSVNDVHIFYDDMGLLEIASMTWKKVKICMNEDDLNSAAFMEV